MRSKTISCSRRYLFFRWSLFRQHRNLAQRQSQLSQTKHPQSKRRYPFDRVTGQRKTGPRILIADGADEWLGYETGYSAAKKWIGNPWGDDWVFFRKLTLFYKVHLIQACLYNQYVR